MTHFYKIKYVLFFPFLFSCNLQKDLVGNYENKFSIPFYEKPIFTIRGIDTLRFQYNIKLSNDSTYLVYNCLCKSEGIFQVKNDSLILINKSEKKDSTPICFEKNIYRIKNGGKKIIKRNGNIIERLYKQKN